MARTLELSTHVPSLKLLQEGDYSAYDSLYLGDYSCPRSPGNLSSNADALREGAETVKRWGKKCYLSLYATPRDSDLGWMRRLLRAVGDMPLDGVEVHDVGLLSLIREVWEGLPAHLGVFSTVYVADTVRALLGYGISRVFPCSELRLEEIEHLKASLPVEVAIPVHGKMPLAIWERCFIAEYEGAEPTQCDQTCNRSQWVRLKSWRLKALGRVTLSGKDLCMIEHLPELVRRGFTVFHIHSLGEGPEYVAAVGRIYRDALERLFAGECFPAAAFLEGLRRLAPWDVCNGYYFQVSGQRYVGVGGGSAACPG